MSEGYEASEAMAWLEANTPEDWCWTTGYHPHYGARGRGPGRRLLTLILLLPEQPDGWLGKTPRFHEEMPVGDGASYLTLAQRAVARAKATMDPQAPVVVPALPACPACGAASGIVCKQPGCAALALHHEQQARLRQHLQHRACGPSD
jgi:hypothetical protein